VLTSSGSFDAVIDAIVGACRVMGRETPGAKFLLGFFEESGKELAVVILQNPLH
jgi:RsiW-degrading membrane proteinase PrsW (M82 family)